MWCQHKLVANSWSLKHLSCLLRWLTVGWSSFYRDLPGSMRGHDGTEVKPVQKCTKTLLPTRLALANGFSILHLRLTAACKGQYHCIVAIVWPMCGHCYYCFCWLSWCSPSKAREDELKAGLAFPMVCRALVLQKALTPGWVPHNGAFHTCPAWEQLRKLNSPGPMSAGIGHPQVSHPSLQLPGKCLRGSPSPTHLSCPHGCTALQTPQSFGTRGSCTGLWQAKSESQGAPQKMRVKDMNCVSSSGFASVPFFVTLS